MSIEEILLIGSISALISFVASTLGLGGAVLLIPALLFIPRLFGMTPLGILAVSGITPIQVFSTSLLAVLLHHRRATVDHRIVLLMGVPIVVSSFAGAYFSGSVAPEFIIVTFSVMALTGAALIIIRREEHALDGGDVSPDKRLAVLISLAVGFFGGLAGAPGAFILSPLMMTVLRIPTRITVGSTLGIVLLASISTSFGKLFGGQVRLDYASAAIVGAIPGSIAGSALSHRLSTTSLRRILSILIAVVGIYMLLGVIGVVPGVPRR